MPDGLRLALGTLTVVPLGAGRVNRATARGVAELAPLVGLGLGLVAAAVLLAARLVGPPPAGPALPAALAVTTLALLTRGLHLDGLADTVDALGSYRRPAEVLAVLRRGDVGPLGVAGLVLTLLLQVLALAAATRDGRGTESVLLAAVVGRLAVTWACTPGVPAARPDGLGALVAGTARRWVAYLTTLVVAVGAAVYGRYDDDGTAYAAGRALLAVSCGLLAAALLRRHAVRRLGGITGDVLGAVLEVAATVVLLVMSVDRPAALRPAA